MLSSTMTGADGVPAGLGSGAGMMNQGTTGQGNLTFSGESLGTALYSVGEDTGELGRVQVADTDCGEAPCNVQSESRSSEISLWAFQC
eukprot:164339-Rhodomonas_salina.2